MKTPSTSPSGTAEADLSPFGTYAPHAVLAAILRATRRCPANWWGKRRAFFLRAIAVRTLRGQPVDVEALGARMRLHPYNNTCEKRILFTPQFFDPEERRLIATRIRENFVFLDIGANVGGYALAMAALAGPRARILAIEPQPDIFQRLSCNIGLNGFGNLKALECAVTDQDGEIILFLNMKNRGETSVHAQVLQEAGGEIRVASRTLLDIIRSEDIDHIDAMKLDVEGAEALALRPYFESAPEALWPRLVAMEQNAGRSADDATAILTQCGYAEILRTRNNIIYERA